MSLIHKNQKEEYQYFIDQMKEIYDDLLEFIDNIDASDDDFTKLIQNIENKGINENKEVFKNFIHIIICISNNYHRDCRFFDKLERILLKFQNSLKANNTNQDIYELFESNKRLLYFLIKEKIITVNENIIRLIKSHKPQYSDFFFPEIQKKRRSKTFKNEELVYYKDHLEEYESKRQAGENDSYICSLIRNDSIEEFVAYVNRTNTSVSSMIKPSIFETNSFLIDNEPTLIEYAAFFGSIQIFQYLYLNKAKVSDSLWLYAIYSNNSDLLRNYIEYYDIKPKDENYENIFIECIKCHHNEIAKYIEDNLITHKNQSQQESFESKVYEAILKYHNYSYFSIKFNKMNSYSFYYLFKCNYKFFNNIVIQICQTLINGKTMQNVFLDCPIYYISETSYKNHISELLLKIKKSKNIFMNTIELNTKDDKDIYVFIGIKDTILFIKLKSITLLSELFIRYESIRFRFLYDQKAIEIFEEFTKKQYTKIDKLNFTKYQFDEIEEYFKKIKENHPIDFVFSKFHQIMRLFLIAEAYDKINRINKNRMKYFISNYEHPSKIPINKTKRDEFLVIDTIDNGNFHNIKLVYYFDTKEMIAIKFPYLIGSEEEILFHRELFFYKSMKHPYLPMFYGSLDKYEHGRIMMEFINGKTLDLIKKLHLEIKDKITIIFKLMIIIEYLHRNEFIYRHLSPRHVMIDNNKEVFLVGFGYAIKHYPNYDDDEHTCDFGFEFSAPEFNYGKYSYQCDIYSLGLMIQYIMSETRPKYGNRIKNEEICQYPVLNKMIQNCIKKSPEERPSICELIIEFYFNFHSLIEIGDLFNVYKECFSNIYDIERIKKLIENAQNDQEDVDFKLGMLYYKAELCPFNYNKSIHHFQQAQIKHFEKANQILDIISKNKDESQYQIRAQINLGYFYLKRKEINQSIHFFTLAANQNNSESQHQLGLIYYENQFIRQDINKAIRYFTLAANQNNSESQHQLGLIYYENRYIRQDIDKAIHYFTLASHQNKPESQHQLGVIYYENKFIQQDILKAIDFFSLADKHNFVESQLILGKIYYENKYVERDAYNVIYYYSRAAEQKNVEALRFLGYAYYNDEIVYRDIQNTIHYFRLAAEQNDSISQCFLGYIYYENKYVKRDIDKAIYYFELAAYQNDAVAQFNLGVIYFEGKYVTRDLSRAKSYFSMSAKQNHQGSIFYLTTLIPKSNI